MAVKTKKRILQYGRLFDLLSEAVFLLISIYISYRIVLSELLPMKYLLLLLAIIILLNMIFFVLIFKHQPRSLAYIKRAVIIMLCVGMLFVSNILQTVHSTLNLVSTNTDTTIHMSVIVPKSSSISNLQELQNGLIGIQTATDKKNTDYMTNEMNKTLGNNFDYMEYQDYSSMAADMILLGNLDAMAISDSYLSMLDTNMEGFKDSYKVIQTYTRKQESSETASDKDISKEPFTVYITGIDELGSPDQNLRSDVNILLMVNPTTNHIQMVSFPRDSYVPNMALDGFNDKLTHTGLYGSDATVQTIENLLGIDIDFYAKVSFSSLIEIVDLIGGIDVDVEIDFCEQDERRNLANQICLNQGMQHINGQQALAYSRHRYSEGYGTSGRERAQQRIIAAIIKKMISPEGIANINALIAAVPNYVLTNMPSKQITGFISGQISNIKPWSISSTTIGQDGINDTRITSFSPDWPQDVYLFDTSEIKRVLYSYQYGMQPFDLSSIHFDMNDLYDSDYPLNDNIVWRHQAISPH